MGFPTPTDMAFRADIIANPKDMGLRLIYADWMDEFGEPWQKERAAHIRWEICKIGCGNKAKMARSDWPDSIYVLVNEEGRFDASWNRKWKDGFVEEIECSTEEFVKYGPKICSLHPIQSVKLHDAGIEHVDREPGFDCWHHSPDVSLSKMPVIISGWWGSENELEEALSRELIRWARQKDGDKSPIFVDWASLGVNP